MEVDLKVRLVGRRRGVLLRGVLESKEVGSLILRKGVLGIILGGFEACRGQEADFDMGGVK